MIVALMGLKQMAIYARQVGLSTHSPEKIMDWIVDDISRHEDTEKLAEVLIPIMASFHG